MFKNSSRFLLTTVAAFIAAILIACNCAPTLRYLLVAPNNAIIIIPGTQESSGKKSAIVGHSAKVTRQKATAQPNLSGASCNTFQYAATAYYSDGSTKDATASAAYSSSNSAVATIDASGIATGVSSGTSKIDATLTGITASPVTLLVDALNFITVTPANSTAASGATVNFSSTGNFTYSDGTTGSQDLSGLAPAWASTNTEVATIDAATGIATAVGQGTTKISSTLCGVVGTTFLTVGPAGAVSLVITPPSSTISIGQTQAYTVMELWSDGTKHTPTNHINWGGGQGAITDEGTGLSRGVTAGSDTINATERGTTLTGSASLTVAPASARFAFVANKLGLSDTGSISSYTVNVSGATLTSIAETTAANAQQVLVHPSGKFLYFIDGTLTSSVHVLYVDHSTGALSVPSPAISAVQAGHGGVTFGAIDPNGKFLYVIDDGSGSGGPATGTIYGFTISQTNGSLTAIGAVSAYATNVNSPSQPLIDPAGQHLYVINSGNDTISEYSIDVTTGALAPLGTPTVATGHNPQYGSINASGNIYVGNHATSPAPQSVSGFHITSGTGELVSVGTPTALGTATAAWNAITDPTGKYLYAHTGNDVAAGQVFAFNATASTGVIGSEIGSAGVAAGKYASGMAVDPSGTLLAVDNFKDSTISLFKIGSDGSLTAAAPATVPTGSNPRYVVFYTAAP